MADQVFRQMVHVTRDEDCACGADRHDYLYERTPVEVACLPADGVTRTVELDGKRLDVAVRVRES